MDSNLKVFAGSSNSSGDLLFTHVSSSLHPLEEIFQKVEEENERRAQMKAIDDRLGAMQRVVLPTGQAVRRERRRASISITKFGQLPDSPSDEYRPETPVSPSHLVTVASKSFFYQSQKHNLSATSITYIDPEEGRESEDEDPNSVTQVLKIVPKRTLSKTVGGILTRRTSRNRSTNSMLSGGETNMVIGIHRIEEAVVETVEEANLRTMTPQIVGGPRSLQFTRSMGEVPSRQWVSRAKVITDKLKRRSTALSALPTDTPFCGPC